jgi:ribosomal protein S27AE
MVALATPSAWRCVLYFVTSDDVSRTARWCPKNGASRWIANDSRFPDRRLVCRVLLLQFFKKRGDRYPVGTRCDHAPLDRRALALLQEALRFVLLLGLALTPDAARRGRPGT